ncbi:MAG: OmpA family protein [Bacteroidales bacterium]|nr:OmpA family protein [Bacteroidales bacterium]
MKGIKMILGVLAAASLFCLNANAQVVRGPYETNKAFDNTWLGIGAGVNTVVLPGAWGNIGLAADVNFGKWFTPAIGARIGWIGLWNNNSANFDRQGIDPNSRFGYNYFHAELLWNISNSICGYNPDRYWSLVPYVTGGVLDISQNPNLFSPDAGHNWEYACGLGLLNVLKMTEKIDVNIDLSVIAGKASAYRTQESMFIFFPTATLGLAFKFGKTGWDRHDDIAPVVVPVPFTEDQYNSLAERAAALEKENADLRDKAAALEDELSGYRNNLVDGQTYLYENGTFTAVDVKPGSPITLYFDCGATTLSAREKAHLEYFTSNVVDADTKLSVNAYADKQTGSAKRNQYLSEQRAKYVADLLVKAGAKEENIESAAHGASVQLFDGAEKNRVVTIEVK